MPRNTLDAPYHEPLGEPLEIGTRIYVTGLIPQGSRRFTINLMTEKNMEGVSSPDIAFHFDVRFGERCVVRNTCNNNGWGTAETEGPFPFYHGQKFEIAFRIEEPTIMVDVDKVHFIDYQHRIPVSLINTLDITRDVIIDGWGRSL